MRKPVVLALLLLASASCVADDCVIQAPSLEVVVRPTDIDDKGHVNNARHIEYLQWGRWHWMSLTGTTPDQVRNEHNAALVVVNVNLDYKREIRFGETVFVRTSVERVGTKSVTFRQAIVGRIPDDVRAEGVVTMVAMDITTRKSIAIPDRLAKILRRHAP